MSTTTTSILNAATMPRLNDTNYISWSARMRALLIRLGLWGLVSGTETLPDADKADTKKVGVFADRQLKACAELILYVEDSQLPHMGGDDPNVIWNELSRVHRARGLSTQLAAVRELSRMEKGASQSMSSWIAEIQAQADIMKAIDIALPDLFVIAVLTSGLPPEYEAVLVALDSIDSKDLTLELAIGRLLNEGERQLSQKLMQDSKAIKGEPEPDSSYAARVKRLPQDNFPCKQTTMGNFGGHHDTRYDDSDDAKNTPIGPTNFVDIDGQNGWIKRTYIIDPSLNIPDLFRPLVKMQKEKNVYLQGLGVDVDLWIVGHKDSECESKKERSLPKKRTTICVGSRDSQMKDREAVTVRIVSSVTVRGPEH